MKDKTVILQMEQELWQATQNAAHAHKVSASEYIRNAVSDKLASEDAILPRPDNRAAVVPVVKPIMRRFVVNFRSADGTLNTETISAKSRLDAVNAYDNVVEITEVTEAHNG